MTSNIAVLIMAAGAATRFGSPKQLAQHQGQTLLQRCIDSANAVFPDKVSVVLGAHADQVEPQILGAQVIINPQWQNGLGGSIACGVMHIDPAAHGVFILLADQIHITPEQLQVIAKAFEGDNIVAAHYCGARGVPAIFPRSYFEKLEGLTEDSGAKTLLSNTELSVTEIALPEAALDIDRPEDLHTL
jgi:molybdenum cofactor cytidylyltransferase